VSGARRALGRAGLGGAGALLALAFLAPYLVMLFTAAKPEAELRVTPPRLTPLVWHWTNFAAVLRDGEFQTWLRVSLVVALASMALVVAAAVPAAYYTARHRFRGRTAFLFLVLVTQMFSPTSLVVGLHRTSSTPTRRSFSPTPRSTSRSPSGSCARSSRRSRARSKRRRRSTAAAGCACSCGSCSRSRGPAW